MKSLAVIYTWLRGKVNLSIGRNCLEIRGRGGGKGNTRSVWQVRKRGANPCKGCRRARRKCCAKAVVSGSSTHGYRSDHFHGSLQGGVRRPRILLRKGGGSGAEGKGIMEEKKETGKCTIGKIGRGEKELIVDFGKRGLSRKPGEHSSQRNNQGKRETPPRASTKKKLGEHQPRRRKREGAKG